MSWLYLDCGRRPSEGDETSTSRRPRKAAGLTMAPWLVILNGNRRHLTAPEQTRQGQCFGRHTLAVKQGRLRDPGALSFLILARKRMSFLDTDFRSEEHTSELQSLR